jgi:serine/threonine protein phosphatase PrpC
MFTHIELENYLRTQSLQLTNDSSLQLLAERLIALALERGSKDNISVLLVKRNISYYTRIKDKFLT